MRKAKEHEEAVRRVKEDHGDKKIKRVRQEPNMGKSKRSSRKEDNERLDSNPSSQNGYPTKAKNARKHRMEAVSQEAGMRKPKHSRY